MIYLTTKHGDRYLIDGISGDIRRMDMPEMAPSGQWRLIGIVRTGPGWAFGTGLIPLAELTAPTIAGLELTHKNRSPRYTVRDFDHGAIRTWGNCKYHGIAELQVLTAEHAAEILQRAIHNRRAGA